MIEAGKVKRVGLLATRASVVVQTAKCWNVSSRLETFSGHSQIVNGFLMARRCMYQWSALMMAQKLTTCWMAALLQAGSTQTFQIAVDLNTIRAIARKR